MEVENKNYIFAFDLSLSRTGISIFGNDGTSILVDSIETKSDNDLPGKLKHIADKVLELKQKYKPQKIIIENAFTRFNTSTQQLYRVHGLINYLFWDVEQIYYAATTIKKTLTGRGNSSKEEVRSWILERYPEIEFKNDDQSDSYSVGLCYFLKNKIIKFYKF